MPYTGGEGTRRYYQDAAIRAVLEQVARSENTGRAPRALLSLATGAGKTFIAVHVLKRIADAGLLRRALFLCDRDELRTQARGAFHAVFGTNAATVSGSNAQPNARVLIATYQTLGVDSDAADATFLTTHYPENYFSHIIIDECHRSAWGKWSQVLLRNPHAVQVGLTATPRRLVSLPGRAGTDDPAKATGALASQEAIADDAITADNLKHFGEPVYEYDMAQGIEDGYLAACEVRRFDLFHDDHSVAERERGVLREDLASRRISDATTGEVLETGDARETYRASDLDDHLLMPERVAAMTGDLFQHFLDTGGPEQKTIIFCARDAHADRVAIALNNHYAAWCAATGHPPADPYAFKCTAASGGADFIPDLKGASRRYFIATTVDLLTTGVDVPAVRNIVFFKYVRSPIAFYQMIGRGTRLDPTTGKLMFRVYDYTGATRLFGEAFLTRAAAPASPPLDPTTPTDPPERTIVVEGFDVHVTPAGHSIITLVDGKAVPISLEEYRARLAARLVAEAPTLDQLRALWIAPTQRRSLMQRLPDAGRSASVIRAVEEMADYDLYDVLAQLGYGAAPRTRAARAAALTYKHAAWFARMPTQASAAVKALAAQFAHSGTEGLENPRIFHTPELAQAGGLASLNALGSPSDVLRETKQRMFSA